MARMADLLTTDIALVNDCIICDTRETARILGRKSWSVSTSGQPLCADHYSFYLEEIRD